MLLDVVRDAWPYADTVSVDELARFAMLFALRPLIGFGFLIAGVYHIWTADRYTNLPQDEAPIRERSRRMQRFALRALPVTFILILFIAHVRGRDSVSWTVACIIAAVTGISGFILSFTKKYADKRSSETTDSQIPAADAELQNESNSYQSEIPQPNPE